MARAAVAQQLAYAEAQVARHDARVARASAAPIGAARGDAASRLRRRCVASARCCSSAATGTRRSTQRAVRAAPRALSHRRHRSGEGALRQCRPCGRADAGDRPPFAPGSIDVIVANGVYGFGIDDRAALGAAFAAARLVLRPGGTLVLGWNDVPALAPFDPEAVAGEAGFERSTRQSARAPAHGDRHAAAPHLRRLRAQRESR